MKELFASEAFAMIHVRKFRFCLPLFVVIPQTQGKLV
jgi:hypothetical protein